MEKETRDIILKLQRLHLNIFYISVLDPDPLDPQHFGFLALDPDPRGKISITIRI